MKNIKLLTILIILIIIAGVYYFSNSKGSLNLRNTSFAIEETDQITEVKISSDKETLLLKKEFGQWKVNDKYNATKWSINNFMMALNRVYILKPVSKVEKEQVASILKSDGILVEIYKNRRAIKKYYVSKPGMNKNKTYMMMCKSSEPFVVGIPSFQGLVSDLYVVEENFWRDKTIFNYQPQNIKTILLEYSENPSKSFQLVNFNDGTFALKDVAKESYVENFNVENLVRYFTYYQRIVFEELGSDLSQKEVDTIMKSKLFVTITVEDINGAKNKLDIYRKPPEDKLDEFGEKAEFDYNRAYAILNNNRDLILIQYYIFDPLFKEIDYFR